ncbi:hypothetical protein Bbelb_191480 [Branchiostoma belcheri]|nr:hypothetical protein Bbelb_191480 [Branchiostoma belcheri]
MVLEESATKRRQEETSVESTEPAELASQDSATKVQMGFEHDLPDGAAMSEDMDDTTEEARILQSDEHGQGFANSAPREETVQGPQSPHVNSSKQDRKTTAERSSRFQFRSNVSVLKFTLVTSGQFVTLNDSDFPQHALHLPAFSGRSS